MYWVGREKYVSVVHKVRISLFTRWSVGWNLMAGSWYKVEGIILIVHLPQNNASTFDINYIYTCS